MMCGLRNGFLILAAVLALAGGVAVGAFAFSGPAGPVIVSSTAVWASPPATETTSPASESPAPAAAGENGEPGVEAGRRILVSIEDRRLWLVEGADTLMEAPVAIGMGKDFVFQGRSYRFHTPRGRRTVIAKASDPVWVVPEWHYYERAAKMGLSDVVKLDRTSRILLPDSSWLVVRENEVGRINHFGHFAPFTPGTEIIYDNRIYVPPLHTTQRRVPEALGPYKLDMGEGYLIHGTHPYNEESVGQAVSHGCVRLHNEDLARLYGQVPRGTPVVIF
jgi:lipoprotein-anchoring transpeptidase ErfK/SrfK